LTIKVGAMAIKPRRTVSGGSRSPSLRPEAHWSSGERDSAAKEKSAAGLGDRRLSCSAADSHLEQRTVPEAAAIAVHLHRGLGVLYESYIHPITILSSLPSREWRVAWRCWSAKNLLVALIGIILLIGSGKNAIMRLTLPGCGTQGGMARRNNLPALPARSGRFMRDNAALLGALPLRASGTGSELRRPLGLRLSAGCCSRNPTLYTTPGDLSLPRSIRDGAKPAGGRGLPDPDRAGGSDGHPRATKLTRGMSVSEPFIRRPAGTSLLAIRTFYPGMWRTGFMRGGAARVCFPMFQFGLVCRGRIPTWRALRALQKRLGQIAGVTEMTSASTMGLQHPLQFDLTLRWTAPRGTAGGHQCRAADLPINLPGPPPTAKSIRRLADSDPAMTSGHAAMVKVSNTATTLWQKLSQVGGVSQAFVTRGEIGGNGADRSRGTRLGGLSLEQVRTMPAGENRGFAEGSFDGELSSTCGGSNDQLTDAKEYHHPHQAEPHQRITLPPPRLDGRLGRSPRKSSPPGASIFSIPAAPPDAATVSMISVPLALK